MSTVIVAGGGAAGMMAAYAAAQSGHRVTLFEKNEKLGKKLYITGKGRCNLTNAGDMEDLLAHVVSNRKFMYSAFSAFDNVQTRAFFEGEGLRTKVERGNRVFPESDKASDVTAALVRAMKRAGVQVRLNTRVLGILTEPAGNPAETAESGEKVETEENTEGIIYRECGARENSEGAARKEHGGHMNTEGSVCKERGGYKESEGSARRVCGVRLDSGTVPADAVILATGGLSYPSTGSDGDGHRMAEACGHTIVPCVPSLVPFVVREEWVKKLQGLSLKNTAIAVCSGKKKLYEDFGEMLFTHFGVSGPVILSASGSIAPGKLAQGLTLAADLKPALDEGQLDRRILWDFQEAKNRCFKNSLNRLLPAKLVPVIVELSGIDGEKPVNEVTRAERGALVRLIKNLTMTVTGTRGWNEAVVTKGGVSVREINPSTMESKRLGGLYLCGELADVDALTGGYNLQIAWSTGYLAGSSIP